MSRTARALVRVLATLAALAASIPALADEEASVPPTAEVAAAYYGALAGEGDLAGIAMAPDLRFRSPRFTLGSEAAFREALAGLVTQVRKLELRNQLIDGPNALTFYRLDLGAPGGPIPMAEHLTVIDGRLVDVELIFDSARLPTPPAEE